jgi:very-short-patch-repair endonuclease
LAQTAQTPVTIRRARDLRQGMTDGERKLWAELREFRRWYSIHVRRQAPIGKYISDFAAHSHKLVIEIDGEFHALPDRTIRDRLRDEWLYCQGYRVLHFTTGELSDSFDGCIEQILSELGLMKLGSYTPTPNPSPQGGGEPGGC